MNKAQAHRQPLRVICTANIHTQKIRLTPVTCLEVLNDVQAARIERREQARQADDLMLWNMTPVVYNYVVSVVLQYTRPFGK